MRENLVQQPSVLMAVEWEPLVPDILPRTQIDNTKRNYIHHNFTLDHKLLKFFAMIDKPNRHSDGRMPQ